MSLEWATRVVGNYERAVKAADAWKSAEELEKMRTGAKGSDGASSSSARRAGGGSGGGVRGKKPATSSPLVMPNGKAKTRPPLDVRLYRYPHPGEAIAESAEPGIDMNEDPFAGLVRVNPGQDWKDIYLAYLGDAEATCAADAGASDNSTTALTSQVSYSVPHAQGPPVLCCIPSCEGPMRKGDSGERVDGRSGMKIVNGKVMVKGGFKHRKGCGHEYASGIWTSGV